MLFWPPEQLPLLAPYPDTHLLRRRSRLNLCERVAEREARWPLAARAVGVEARLSPGDVIFFPARWAHYTEGLTPSISVTWRYAADGTMVGSE